MKRRLFTLALFLLLGAVVNVVGCATSQPDQPAVGVRSVTGGTMEVQLLYFSGCPMSPTMRENLREALVMLGREPVFEEIDLEALPQGDPLLRFASPTVLVRGRDLMGQPPAREAMLACRIYPGGVPDAGQLAERLR